MVAGSVGIRVTVEDSNDVLYTVQAVSDWFIFEVKGDKTQQENKDDIEEKKERAKKWAALMELAHTKREEKPLKMKTKISGFRVSNGGRNRNKPKNR